MPHDLPAEIAEALRRDFGLSPRDALLIVGGRDAAARVWTVVDSAGAAWAVKTTRRDNRFGLLLAQSLGRAGVAGIPEQAVAGDGLPWTDLDEKRLSVSRWVDGREAFEEGLGDAEWRRFGVLLRAVHEHEMPPGSTWSMDGARRGIRRAETRIRRRLTELDARLASGDADLTAAGERLRAAWPTIRARLESLRETSRRLKASRRPTTRVICHGDPHLGNVLVDADGQPWLIDFDDAVRAPREVDLMLIELGVLFSLPVTTEERRSFHLGYGPVDLDDERLVRFGCVRAVEDVVETAYQILALGPDAEPTVIQDLDDLLAGLLSPRGLVGLVEVRAGYTPTAI